MRLVLYSEVEVEVGVANEEFYVCFKTFESSSAPLVPRSPRRSLMVASGLALREGPTTVHWNS